MDAKLTELVLRESDYVMSRAVPGFLLTIRDGMIAPNAGIDKSNVPRGYAILYPRNPFETAEKLNSNFLPSWNKSGHRDSRQQAYANSYRHNRSCNSMCWL